MRGKQEKAKFIKDSKSAAFGSLTIEFQGDLNASQIFNFLYMTRIDLTFLYYTVFVCLFVRLFVWLVGFSFG